MGEAFAAEDTECSSSTQGSSEGPFPVDVCCTMPPSQDWSTRFYSGNNTLIQFSNSPQPDAHCALFQDGTWQIPANQCISFSVPPTVAVNMKVRVDPTSA